MPNHRTPLFAWHTARGARMVPFGGWDMPVQYAGVLAEHRAVRTAAGLFDISHMARLDVAGPAAEAFLEDVFTNAVGTMRVGQVRYGLVCDASGGVLDDVLVYKFADGFAAVVNASNRDKILAHFAARKAGRDVTVTDRTFDTAMLAVQGPTAADQVSGLFADDVSARLGAGDFTPSPLVGEGGGGGSPLPTSQESAEQTVSYPPPPPSPARGEGVRGRRDPISQLQYYFAVRTTYRGSPAVVSRTGYTGEDGFEVTVPADLAVPLADELVARGAVPCGLGARDTLRLEAGMPLYGHELSEHVDPIRAGLGWAVKLDKGEFVGRDALRPIAADPGRSPVRVGLELDGKRAAREGTTLLHPDGTPAGTVTSGSFAPTLSRSIAMAYVDASAAAVGTRLHADVRGSLVPAAVVPLPFYRRQR